MLDTISVMTLAPQGAGKTVLLSAMFDRLSVQRPDLGFFLDTDLAHSRALNNIHSRVIAPDKHWPDKTMLGEMGDWDFTCCVRAGGQVHEVLKVSYLDFAGEHLTEDLEADQATTDQFERRIREAKALLVLLDGEQLFYLMRGEPSGETYLRTTMGPIFGLAGLAVGVRPIHFVITKWDALAGYSLAEVKDRLLRYDKFADLVQGHEGNVMRLIPVSAVGDGFARLDESAEEMVKTGNPFVSAVNVDVPFTALLIDMFNQVEKTIDPRPPAGQQRWARLREVAINLLNRGKGRLPSGVRANVPDSVADIMTGISEELLTAAVDYLNKSNQAQADALQPVRDKQSALQRVIASFDRRLAQFERDYPGSRLDLETVR